MNSKKDFFEETRVEPKDKEAFLNLLRCKLNECIEEGLPREKEDDLAGVIKFVRIAIECIAEAAGENAYHIAKSIEKNVLNADVAEDDDHKNHITALFASIRSMAAVVFLTEFHLTASDVKKIALVMEMAEVMEVDRKKRGSEDTNKH